MSAAAKTHGPFRIGKTGIPWGDAERKEWLGGHTKQRDYFTDIVSPLLRFKDGDVFQYGSLDYRKHGYANYPLYAVKSSNWDEKRPLVLVTGGVHGYESSGIHGALLFVKEQLAKYSERLNVLVLPCISPWGYEIINRWNPDCVDPNRCFVPPGGDAPQCQEAILAMACVNAQKFSYVLQHTDLHETTDSDNVEFIPSKNARDGLPPPEWDPIPDGFYIIGDDTRPQLEWHKAMIEAVKTVTHIAQPDERNTLVGETPEAEGILILPSIGDCGSFTPARYATTTEVYPDSEKTTPEICNVAQMTCVVAGLEFALKAEGV